MSIVHHPFPGYWGFVSFIVVIVLSVIAIVAQRKRQYGLSVLCYTILLAYGCWEAFL